MSRVICCGLLLQILSIFIFKTNCNGSIWPVTTTIKEDQGHVAHYLSEALVKIIEECFLGKYGRRHFNFHMKTKNAKNRYFFEDVIDETWHLLDNQFGIILGSENPIPITDDIQYCILLVDSVESLRHLYYNILNYHLYISGSYFIVLYTLPLPSRYYDQLYEASAVSLSAGITHADILIYAGSNSILLFHDLPYSSFHCRANVPVIHNRFNNGVWLHTNFYVTKTKNLYRCPLVCATWQDMPYFEVQSESEDGPVQYTGIEGKLLEYLSLRMNFTISIRWMNTEEINRTTYDENGVLTEVSFNNFGIIIRLLHFPMILMSECDSTVKTRGVHLFENGADFVLGAFHYKPRLLSDSYTPSQPYFLSSYCFVISARSQPFGGFTKLLLPFSKEIWIILAFLFICGNLVIFSFSKMDGKLKHMLFGRKEQKYCYNMIVVCLGGPVPHDPGVPFSRFLLLIWLWASFVLRTVYEGLMYDFIRTDLKKVPPKTFQELVELNYYFLMTDKVYERIRNISQLSQRAIILNDTEINSFDMLHHPENYDHNKLALLTLTEYYVYFRQMDSGAKDLYVLPEILFNQQLSIYMMKNSPFLYRFNMYIKHFVNEGLMHRWSHHILPDGGHYLTESEGRPKVISLDQLLGAFNLLIICLFISFCVFIIEISMFKLKGIKRRISRKWYRRNM
ncbi:ionotropic receptor 7b [Haematobia irritans]|uniref:ionotropic receptor 7b n=1 Tax=Haematobia irritans TaxID=7368 RepID=UPI003F4FCC42